MAPDVTIVVVPREQFSKTEVSLESIFQYTALPFALIYVDGASPPPVRGYLERRAAVKNFRLIRTERCLPANVARNLAFPHVTTKYTVFIDNDVAVSAHWLEPLLACAEETGCAVVGPLYCVGDLADPIIHTLGADHGIYEEDGKRHWHERHLWHGRRLNEVRTKLQRRPIDLVEFHCLMARTDMIRRLGEFDPALLSYFDHNEFCLRVKEAGGAIYAEPRSVVTYYPPPPFALSDVPFFLLRWSNRWIESSAMHFAAKHGLDIADPVFARHYEYQQEQRARLLRHPRQTLRRLFGDRGMSAMEAVIGRVLDWTVVARG
jgi:GT2 family glycosyltransferase